MTKWQMNGQLRAHATQALADTQLRDWDTAVLAIERQMLKFAEFYAAEKVDGQSDR